MSRKINPIGIRIPYTKTWPSLWHSSVTYSSLLYQDFFLRKYLKFQLRKYRVELAHCEVKRTLNTTFISLFVFNANVNANFQFKPFLFLRSYYLLKHIFYTETPHFIKAIQQFFGVTRVIFNFCIIRNQKPNFRTIALTANPILLGNYFMRKYTKMNSYRRILKSFRGLYSSLRLARFNLKGLKIRVAGPVRAPRTRRSQIIKKLYFGTTPIQTFSSLILYVARSRALDEGVVSMRAWLYKKTGDAETYKENYVYFFVKKIWKSRRHLLRIFKTIRRRRESRTKLWRLIFTKFTKLQRRSNKTPFFFYFNWLKQKVVGYLRPERYFETSFYQPMYKTRFVHQISKAKPYNTTGSQNSKKGY
jgi:ribosomal protein S3